VKPEEAAKLLERANPFPPGDEQAWAQSGEGRAVLARVLAHPLPASPPHRPHRGRFVALTGLTVLVVVFVAALLFRMDTSPAPEAGVPGGSVAEAPLATAPATTPSDDPDLLSPLAEPLEELAVRSRLIVSGRVIDVAPASEPGWTVLTVAVDDVWRGVFASEALLRAMVSLPAEPSLGSHPARGGDLASLLRQEVVVFAPEPPTDSARPEVWLVGDERVYVRKGESLLRVSYFLRAAPDPASETLASLRAAVEKAGRVH
jgi:hypothetical protein